MQALGAQERFEEAASARDRLRALAEALARARVDGWLLTTSLELLDTDGVPVRVDRGALVRDDDPTEPLGSPCPRERADELGALRSWIARNPVRLVDADTPIAEPVDGGARLHSLLTRLRQRPSEARRRER
jgi:hypothetical protein